MLSRSKINARGLIRLRWATIAGQLATIAVAELALSVPLPIGALGAVIAFEICVNVVAIALEQRQPDQTPRWLSAFMAIDLLILTALLYLTGGPMNPFNFLYVVHIALAAVILPSRWAWGLGLVSIVAFGFLFVDHHPLPMAPGHDAGEMHWHVQGMWFAFVVAAVAITLFVGRLARDLEQRSAQLASMRDKAHRAEKLGAMATLATGAAHELATPLSTIAVVAKDLEYEAANHGGDSPLVDDARLIRQQVDRCRAIIDQLASDTGQTLGESVSSVTVAELIEEAIAPLDGGEALDIDIAPELDQRRFFGPRRSLVHAARALIKNALQASPQGSPVVVRATRPHGSVRLEVIDRGSGIAEDIQSRVTEPFFSTRAEGEGTGLGLFLAQSVADMLDGQLILEVASPSGTRAILELPLEPTAHDLPAEDPADE
jgi:two-component system, sensor histidine kinase RegB